MIKLWRRLMWRRYFTQDGAPIRCTECGCTELQEKVTDRLDNWTMEAKTECSDCGTTLGYWAHGHQSPDWLMKYLQEEQN